MPFSMTGFATHAVVSAPFQLVWELRSVNHRFLDLSLKLPEEMRALEPRCRELVNAAVKRGKVDCALRWSGAEDGQLRRVDVAALAELRHLSRAVLAEHPEARPLAIADILRWPGVVSEPRPKFDAVAEPALQSLVGALADFQAGRAREGLRIAEFLGSRVEGIEALLATIRPRLEGVQQRHRVKLAERLARLEIDTTPERFEQEIGFVVQRLDVEEEVDRLVGHLAEVRHALALEEPVGRRLDFLIQELNREANTFASKVQDDELTRSGVDIKVLIEQMREQVQNLE
jgi:uncharacterized protein (TIGR00255 family)